MVLIYSLAVFNLLIMTVFGMNFTATPIGDKTSHHGACAELSCSACNSVDKDIEYIESMTLFRHVRSHVKVAVASISPFQPKMTNECEAHVLQANFSTHHADIELKVRNQYECDHGEFTCEIRYINVEGEGRVREEIVHLGQEGRCEVMVEKLGQRLKILDNLSTKLSDVVTKLDKEPSKEEETPPAIPTSCDSVRNDGKTPQRSFAQTEWGFTVVCDSVIDGGGWTVIQRQLDGSTNFTRSWDEYKEGFGDVTGDFWLGNERIHLLTSKETVELRIDLYYDFQHQHASYSSFNVGSEEKKYKLKLGQHSGTLSDRFRYHDNMKFSTFDQDNDQDTNRNCATSYNSGWWYNACYWVHLNGVWGDSGPKGGLVWTTGSDYIMLWRSEMLIRPIKISSIVNS